MIGDPFVLVAEFGLMPIASLADSEGSAGQSSADLSVPDCPFLYLVAIMDWATRKGLAWRM